MDDVIIMAILSVLGFVGYVVLCFAAKEPRHRLGNVLIAIYGLVLLTAIVSGLFVNWHIYFWWESLVAFSAIYGFAACVFLIYAAKGLRLWLPKEMDYYEKKEGARK